MVKVKICGLTNYEDATAAIHMGADILGFNFYSESPRYIPPEEAIKIIDKLPVFSDIAGVFVDANMQEIHRTINLCQLNWVQLHGDETPQFCSQLASYNVKTMKAIRVRSQADIRQANDYFTDAILLDAFDPQKYGGTGLTFDWNIIGHINKRIFLAGGINSDNVISAIELGVYGIDICSGIEERPGKKDHKKMKLLFDKIRQIRG